VFQGGKMGKTWVSYVYCDRKKGDSGIRSRENTLVEPLSELQKDPNIHITATGLTFKQAESMLSLTPEICRFTAAVNLIFGHSNDIGTTNSGSNFKYNDIIHWLFGAYHRVLEDREDRQKYHLVQTDDYLDTIVDAYAGDTGKYLIFRKMSTLFEIRPDGSIVNLEEATLSLGKEIMSFALEDQIAKWKNEKAKSKTK
jgi:hypothetical protein